MNEFFDLPEYLSDDNGGRMLDVLNVKKPRDRWKMTNAKKKFVYNQPIKLDLTSVVRQITHNLEQKRDKLCDLRNHFFVQSGLIIFIVRVKF